ncbi:ATP-binding protein [Dactylosporangium sp. NPDC049525]|uniref:ATP-binding protein n=1 Tax=Dactylosporangium sp. NPDC049525 TaxID=3154730 RepID=UPI00343CE8B1
MSHSRRRELRMVPLDPAAFDDRYVLADDELTLGELLAEQPAYALEPLDPDDLKIRVSRLLISAVEADAATPLFRPPGIAFPVGTAAVAPAVAAGAAEEPAPGSGAAVVAAVEHPEAVDERWAVLIAHDVEISRAAGYLDSGLSVLVTCEKLLVEHLVAEIAGRSGRRARIVEPERGDGGPADPIGGAGGRRQEVLAAINAAVREAKPNDVVVVPHLDLLAGGTDATLNAEARELTDVLYERSAVTLLAFTDPSLMVPEVLANRFAVRLSIDILPREVASVGGAAVPIGAALVTRAEAELFAGFEARTLYKHIAGMNPVRLRHAVRYAYHIHRGRPASFGDLVAQLRTFKARTAGVEVPNVTFREIGGYADVRRELERAIEIIRAADRLPDKLRFDLVPRGFIFHGPPGTGKTLFAKAIANAFDATILIVSGPEITDMYVGESERKVREIFAEARRNAPAVIVFDEFDSIASRRSGRDDGGSRAGNAMVAQLLTEMDGFRPEVPVIVIGTTNRIDIIDDALLRPSRFKPIRIDLPDEEARRAIAKVHARHFDVAVDEDLIDRIARATAQLNGDEIRSVFRDARADELVGDPPQPADARRLGELVGRLRLANQERDAEKQAAAGPARRAATRPARVPLTPPRPAAANPNATTANAINPTATEGTSR